MYQRVYLLVDVTESRDGSTSRQWTSVLTDVLVTRASSCQASVTLTKLTTFVGCLSNVDQEFRGRWILLINIIDKYLIWKVVLAKHPITPWGNRLSVLLVLDYDSSPKALSFHPRGLLSESYFSCWLIAGFLLVFLSPFPCFSPDFITLHITSSPPLVHAGRVPCSQSETLKQRSKFIQDRSPRIWSLQRLRCHAKKVLLLPYA